MSPSTRSAGFGEQDPKRAESEPSMAVLICFAATEDTNALLIIFCEVSKNDVNESGIVNQTFFSSTRTRHLALRDAVRWVKH